MKQELDCDSDEEKDWKSDDDKKSSGESDLHHEDYNCSTKILAELGNEWDSFIHSLFICLKLTIANVLSRSLAPSITGAGDQNCDSSTFVVLRSRLKNANWSTAAAIILALCNTLKYLKQDGADKLLEAYMDCVYSFLFHVPWDVIEELQVGHGVSEWYAIHGTYSQHFQCMRKL